MNTLLSCDLQARNDTGGYNTIYTRWPPEVVWTSGRSDSVCGEHGGGGTTRCLLQGPCSRRAGVSGFKPPSPSPLLLKTKVAADPVALGFLTLAPGENIRLAAPLLPRQDEGFLEEVLLAVDVLGDSLGTSVSAGEASPLLRA